MSYEIQWVDDMPELWSTGDPVRPELDVEFKTAPGRSVCGLLGNDGCWKAFLCYALTTAVPRDVKELEELTDEGGSILVPYTVWSYEKGAGRLIIDRVLTCVRELAMGIDRVVTLSPLTDMARKFHLRNDAAELQVNETTVNFEYEVP